MSYIVRLQVVDFGIKDTSAGIGFKEAYKANFSIKATQFKVAFAKFKKSHPY
jgi:hypothetical protein